MTVANELKIVLSAEDRASTAIRGLGNNLQSIGKVAAGALVGGMVAATGAVIGLGAGMAKLAADAEPVANIRSSFEGLTSELVGGSDAMLGALQRASGGLISNTELMKTFNAANQLIGEDFAVMLPDAMGSLSKVAASTGEDMGFLLDSLVRGVGRLSPAILDNLSIQVNLTEAYEEYAESIGKSADELTKQEQQTALATVAIQKLAENTASMPDPTGQFASFSVVLQNLKDDIGSALLPVMSPFVGMLGDLASRIGPMVVGIIERFSGPLRFIKQAFEELISGNISGFFDNIRIALWNFMSTLGLSRETIEMIIKPFDILREIIEEVIKSVRAGLNPFETLMEVLDNFLPESTINMLWGFYDALVKIATPIIDGIKQFVSFKDILIAFGVAIAAFVIPIIASIVAALLPIIATIAVVVGAIALLRNAWENNWLGIRDIVANAIEFVRGFIESALTWISEFWSANGEQIIASALTIWETIKTAIATAIEIARTVIESVLTAISTFWAEHGEQIIATVLSTWEWIKSTIQTTIEIVSSVIQTVLAAVAEFWANHGETIMNTVRTAFEIIKTVVTTAITVVQTVITAVLTAIQTFWSQHGEQIMSIVQSVFGTIVNVISTIINTIQNVITTTLAAIQSFWSQHGQTILAAANTVWNAIKSVIQTVISVIQSIFNAFRSAFQGDWTAFGQHLRTAWDTIWNAIKTAVSNILPAIIDIVRNLITRIISFFTDTDWGQLGQSIIDGIINGLSAGKDAVIGFIMNIANGAVDAIKGFFGIESPSKLMFDIGENVVDGLIKGMKRKINPVRVVADEIAKAAKIKPGELEIGTKPFDPTRPQIPVDPDGWRPSQNVVNNFNMVVNTNATQSTVAADYDLMRSIIAGF